MRLDRLWIKSFKNLKDFEINFDKELQPITVFIGHNGTGKSNVIEALVIIFRDLDLGKSSIFSYDLTYSYRKIKVQIIADSENSHLNIFVDGSKISLKKFNDYKTWYLPNHVFVYYSGLSERLESYFHDHQKKFYDEFVYGEDLPLRRFFYARAIYSYFILLSCLSFPDEESTEFIQNYLGISKLESVLFILKKPARKWKGEGTDERFWNAKGIVLDFLREIYNYSLAPIRVSEKREKINHLGFLESKEEDLLYLYIPNGEIFNQLAGRYNNSKDFFKILESTYLSDLIYDININVIKKETKDVLEFKDSSEGEQQLLTVLGLLKFNEDDESLFLLDEPDTHLNPAWKLNYLNLIYKFAGKQETSQTIICTHDPLLIGGLIRSQVQIFYRDEKTKKIIARPPEIDPKGMGVSGLLRSELFGLSTTLDPDTQNKINKKLELSFKSQLTKNELEELNKLSVELGSLDFTRTIRDPFYDRFLRAISSREEFKRQILTPPQIKEQEKIARKLIDEILEEEK